MLVAGERHKSFLGQAHLKRSGRVRNGPYFGLQQLRLDCLLPPYADKEKEMSSHR